MTKSTAWSTRSNTVWVDGKGQDSRPRYIVLTEEGVEFFKELSKGRGRGELLFLRPPESHGLLLTACALWVFWLAWQTRMAA